MAVASSGVRSTQDDSSVHSSESVHSSVEASKKEPGKIASVWNKYKRDVIVATGAIIVGGLLTGGALGTSTIAFKAILEVSPYVWQIAAFATCILIGLYKSLPDVQGELKKQKLEIQGLEAEVTEREEEVEALEADVTERQDQVEALEALVSGQNDKIQDLEADVTERQDEVKRLKELVSEQKHEIESFAQFVLDQKHEIDDLKVRLLLLTKEGREGMRLISLAKKIQIWHKRIVRERLFSEADKQGLIGDARKGYVIDQLRVLEEKRKAYWEQKATEGATPPDDSVPVSESPIPVPPPLPPTDSVQPKPALSASSDKAGPSGTSTENTGLAAAIQAGVQLKKASERILAEKKEVSRQTGLEAVREMLASRQTELEAMREILDKRRPAIVGTEGDGSDDW